MTKGTRLKLIHCADIHLDATVRAFGREDYAQQRLSELKTTFLRIIEAVQREQADLLLISGDMFEHGTVSRHTMRFVAEAFAGLQPVPVLLVPGNHDPYVGDSWYRQDIWSDNVHILHDEQSVCILPQLTVQAAGIGFNAFLRSIPPLALIPPARPDNFNLLLYHGAVGADPLDNPYNPVSLAALEALNYDYVALGHSHHRFVAGARGQIINPGNPEPLGFGEAGEHGIYRVTLERGGLGAARVESVFLPCACREYVTLDVDVTGVVSHNVALRRITDRLVDYRPERHLMRLRLTGRTQERPDAARLAEGLLSGGVWKYVTLRDETRRDIDLDRVVEEPTLRGVFARQMLDAAADAHAAGNTLQALRLEKALMVGLEALEHGTVSPIPEGGL